MWRALLLLWVMKEGRDNITVPWICLLGAVKARSRYPLEQKELPFLPSTDLELVNMFLWPVGQQQHCLGCLVALCQGELAPIPIPNPERWAVAAPLPWPLAPFGPQAHKGRLTWAQPV